MKNYVCGYDKYENAGTSQQAICIIKKGKPDKIIFFTTRKRIIKIALFLMKLVGIRIITEVNQ